MQQPCEVWNRVIAKATEHGLDSLTKEERTVFFVNTFLIEFENGGLIGTLYNVRPTLRETAMALHLVGDTVAAEILREAAKLFAATPNERNAKWRAYLSLADPGGRIKTWHNELSPRVAALYNALERYTAQHLSKLGCRRCGGPLHAT